MRREDDNTYEGMIDRICETCGRKFLPAPLHQYVDYRGGRKLYYCSWNCYCRRGQKKAKKYNQKKVLMYGKDGTLLREFDGIKEAAVFLSSIGIVANMNHIQNACRGVHKSLYGYVWKYK